MGRVWVCFERFAGEWEIALLIGGEAADRLAVGWVGGRADRQASVFEVATDEAELARLEQPSP